MTGYSDFVNTIANLTVMSETITDATIALPSTNDEWNQILPQAINYAEMRIYRELNLLTTVVRDSTTNLTANTRRFVLPTASGRFVAVQGVNVVTPVGATTTTGTRNELVHTKRLFMDFFAKAELATSSTAVPVMFAMLDDNTILVGPAPGATYNIEIVGTVRPTALSASNTDTYITRYLNDLMTSATMIYMSGYQKNFGTQVSNPQEAMSWEAVYQKAFTAADTEEQRKRYNVATNGGDT